MKCSRRAAVLVAAMVLGAKDAMAIELLGLKLGASAQEIGECQSREVVRGVRIYPQTDQASGQKLAGPCLEHEGASIGTGVFSDDENVLARPANHPSFLVPRSPVRVTLRDGVVHELRIRTRGVDVQRSVAEALVEKLGTPTAQSVVAKENSFGASFDVIRMFWQLPDGSVEFYGALTRFDEGLVSVLSPAAAQERDERIEQRIKADRF